jgi:hypothetical protein
MVRMVALFEREVDPDRYQRHLDEFVEKVECRAFRQGKPFGSPFDAPGFAHYAEFEWDDMDAFRAATQSQEFAATGKDAMEMGIPFTVTFVELAE